MSTRCGPSSRSAPGMDVHDWRGALLRLDVHRECTAGTTEDCCWLCDCLWDWNCVLSDFGLHLSEPQLGRLCLSTHIAERTLDMGDTPFSAADFIAWLPRKHWCIEALELRAADLVRQNIARFCPSQVSTSLAGRLSKLRTIIFKEGAYSKHWSAILDALGPMEQLEELKMSLHMDHDFALSLARLLATSAGSIKKVALLRGRVWNEELDMLMCGIYKCRKLRELQLQVRFNLRGLADFTGWLRETETLEVLSIENMEIDTEDNNEAVMAAVVDLVQKSTSLKELRCEYYQHRSLANAFKALEGNIVLRSLVVGCQFHYNDSWMGAVLTSMLRKNEGLKSLTFKNCTVSKDAATLISGGLCANRTLEVLDLSSCYVDFSAAQVLCSALKQNTTLHLLRLGEFTASPAWREPLAEEVRANGWYKRLQVNWADCDVPGLEAAVANPSLCPNHLELSTDHLSLESFVTLCSALSSSRHVQSVTLCFFEFQMPNERELLELLSDNEFLERLVLHGDEEEQSYVGAILHLLCFHSIVPGLEASSDAVATVYMATFASLLRTNETLSKVVLICGFRNLGLLNAISHSLCLNKVITDFSIRDHRDNDHFTWWSQSAVQQNRSCLHRAARFVLKKNVGKGCAEAFEHFEGKASLIPCVMSAAGMSRGEAEDAVRRARQFILGNYFKISGVIQSELQCYAGSGMQIDQLNTDCLLEIVKHLKVADVIERLE